MSGDQWTRPHEAARAGERDEEVRPGFSSRRQFGGILTLFMPGKYSPLPEKRDRKFKFIRNGTGCLTRDEASDGVYE